MKRQAWFFLLLVLLAGCGEGWPSLMPPTYPATKYFTGDLLALAQLIEHDEPKELARRLTFGHAYMQRQAEQDGMTLIMYAMMNRRKDCLTVLLTHGQDPNQNTHLGKSKLQIQPVGIAAGGEDNEILTILLDHGGNPNSRFDDEPALFATIKNDHYDHMRLLLDRGADINSTNKDGNTLVNILSYTNRFEQIAYLIKRGADVHKPNNHGATLAFSVQDSDLDPEGDAHKWQQIVKQLLIERGVKFPVPHPGIAFQARVRQENRQRRQWEATPEGADWLARLSAATQSREAGAANEAMQLRQQAEPAFQAWRKTQPGWLPTTNDGSFPLYNSPTERDLAEPEPADSVPAELRR